MEKTQYANVRSLGKCFENVPKILRAVITVVSDKCFSDTVSVQGWIWKFWKLLCLYSSSESSVQSQESPNCFVPRGPDLGASSAAAWRNRRGFTGSWQRSQQPLSQEVCDERCSLFIYLFILSLVIYLLPVSVNWAYFFFPLNDSGSLVCIDFIAKRCGLSLLRQYWIIWDQAAFVFVWFAEFLLDKETPSLRNYPAALDKQMTGKNRREGV